MDGETPRIGILGGGITGLITSYLLKDLEPMAISTEFGGNWGRGGVKLLRYNSEIERIFIEHNIRHTIYNVTSGWWWEGTMWEPADVPEVAHRAYYLKSRGTADGYGAPTNRGEVDRCFDFDYKAFIEACDITQRAASVIGLHSTKEGVTVITNDGAKHVFDYVITTLPVLALRNMNVNFEIPDARYECVTVGSFKAMVRSPYSRMYVYLPESLYVDRISRMGLLSDVWTMETTNDIHFMGNPPISAKEYWAKALNDIRYILPDATLIEHIGRIPGFLTPLSQPIEYPKNIIPVGRYATWQPRERADEVVRRVLAWRDTL